MGCTSSTPQRGPEQATFQTPQDGPSQRNQHERRPVNSQRQSDESSHPQPTGPTTNDKREDPTRQREEQPERALGPGPPTPSPEPQPSSSEPQPSSPEPQPSSPSPQPTSPSQQPTNTSPNQTTLLSTNRAPTTTPQPVSHDDDDNHSQDETASACSTIFGGDDDDDDDEPHDPQLDLKELVSTRVSSAVGDLTTWLLPPSTPVPEVRRTTSNVGTRHARTFSFSEPPQRSRSVSQHNKNAPNPQDHQHREWGGIPLTPHSVRSSPGASRRSKRRTVQAETPRKPLLNLGYIDDWLKDLEQQQQAKKRQQLARKSASESNRPSSTRATKTKSHRDLYPAGLGVTTEWVFGDPQTRTTRKSRTKATPTQIPTPRARPRALMHKAESSSLNAQPPNQQTTSHDALQSDREILSVQELVQYVSDMSNSMSKQATRQVNKGVALISSPSKRSRGASLEEDTTINIARSSDDEDEDEDRYTFRSSGRDLVGIMDT